MIERATVLVLGAGASRPYGFPLGGELLKLICDGDAQLVGHLLGAGFDRSEIESFLKDLARSGEGSVDVFLGKERWARYSGVGRAAIAATLIPDEMPSKLFPHRGQGQSWYELLWGSLNFDSGHFGKNRLSVVTFNYDRSLEFYLSEVLHTNHGNRSDGAAARDLASIEILHVHGSLGDLGELTYGHSIHNGDDSVRKAATRLIVLGDDVTESAQFRRARELLEAAEVIVFLGFGFNEKSVERLGIFQDAWDDSRRAKTFVAATTLGLDNSPFKYKTLIHETLKGACQSHPAMDAYRFLAYELDLTLGWTWSQASKLKEW